MQKFDNGIWPNWKWSKWVCEDRIKTLNHKLSTMRSDRKRAVVRRQIAYAQAQLVASILSK